MENNANCGCKGIRSCLVCKPNVAVANHIDGDVYVYCIICNKAWPSLPSHLGKNGVSYGNGIQQDEAETEGSCAEMHYGKDVDFSGSCPQMHCGTAVELPGVFILPGFISDEEEHSIVTAIDESPWKPSQSGRFKQDYGPRVNFKRRKLKCTGFTGLPSFSRSIVAKLASVPVLSDFKPVEQCHLEYVPDRGSSIDPHIDDTWLWGERLVTINLLSDTYLAMTPVRETGKNGPVTDGESQQSDNSRTIEIRIPMPRKALIVLYGEARYNWEHAIPRDAIEARRIALTIRELTPEFLEGGDQAEAGKNVLETALTFNGTVLN